MQSREQDQLQAETETLRAELEAKELLVQQHKEALEAKDDKIDSLNEQLEAKDERINDLVDQLKRLQAEFENFEKRTEREKEEFKKFAKKELVEGLLDVIDDFERAIESLEEDDHPNVEGIRMVFNNFHKELRNHGIEPIDALGEKADPNYHDVIKRVDSNEDKNVIVDELQRGYTFHDKLLRPSKVIVSGGSQ